MTPGTSISPDQVARVVARLRRGWIGVFVTTGVFSRQAQVEVIDDQYPLVLVSGQTLAEQVLRMAAADFDGDLHALLQAVVSSYGGEVTQRRPEEILRQRRGLVVHRDGGSSHGSVRLGASDAFRPRSGLHVVRPEVSCFTT